MIEQAETAGAIAEACRLKFYLARLKSAELDRLWIVARRWCDQREPVTPLGPWLQTVVHSERLRRGTSIEADRAILPLFDWKLHEITGALLTLHCYSRQSLSPGVDEFLTAAMDVLVTYLHSIAGVTSGGK